MSKITKKIVLSKIIIFVILFFSSCLNNNDKNKKDVFRYNEYRNITSLDPAFARNPQNIWPINQLFNGLVQLDDSLNIIPKIAKSWSISKDGLKHKFVLRNDVFFHESIHFEKNKTRKVIAQILPIV